MQVSSLSSRLPQSLAKPSSELNARQGVIIVGAWEKKILGLNYHYSVSTKPSTPEQEIREILKYLYGKIDDLEKKPLLERVSSLFNKKEDHLPISPNTLSVSVLYHPNQSTPTDEELAMLGHMTVPSGVVQPDGLTRTPIREQIGSNPWNQALGFEITPLKGQKFRNPQFPIKYILSHLENNPFKH
jgi:hypothetical protein